MPVVFPRGLGLAAFQASISGEVPPPPPPPPPPPAPSNALLVDGLPVLFDGVPVLVTTTEE